MVKLEKKKLHPTIYFPSEWENNKYMGKIYGYYVEDTNQYNVISAKNDNNKLTELGEIINKNDLTETNSIVGYYEEGKLIFLDALGNKCKNEPYSLKMDIFSRNTGILESGMMLEMGAVILGCGSVGSLATLELAKSGVGRFLLIDNDIFGYHNICRHQCGIYDVGKYKTEALKERVLQINPTAYVEIQSMTIQEVPLGVFDKFCDANTIVIGGADNREGDLYASEIAKEVGMPLMSIGCWERAFAGEIFYSIPDDMPDYSDFMVAIGTTSGRATQNKKFYTNEEDLAKVSFEPGISVDIDFVTIIAMKLAIDILNRNNDNYTPRLLGHLSQYTLVCNTNNPLVGGDTAEIFAYPLQVTTSLDIPYANKNETKNY